MTEHLAIHDDLIAGICNQQIADDNLTRVKHLFLPLPDHSCHGLCQEGDPVQFPLGSHLLGSGNRYVEEGDNACKERILGAAKQQKQQRQTKEHDVEEGKDVVAQDLAIGAAGPQPDFVTLPLRSPGSRFRFGQSPWLSLTRLPQAQT